ncbi:MAG TPA: D-sedoheptulose 7-phosphate isomerase [Candidatus Norongarragalinales archaeon]|nr:D-sedoheptulose 7-phosphate isomerase [Candidatus Norongarragalinales archaeon]
MEIDEIKKQLNEGAEIRRKSASQCAADIEKAFKLLLAAYAAGNKLLICGNGGSAADSQHIAAELVGRFKKERRALPAIALSTDTSILTSLSNDYAYEIVFKRQVEAHGAAGDVLLALSTSGNSGNVLAAAKEARKRGMKVVALTGQDGGKLRRLADVCIRVPSQETDKIQEVHIAIGHIICDLIEKSLF